MLKNILISYLIITVILEVFGVPLEIAIWIGPIIFVFIMFCITINSHHKQKETYSLGNVNQKPVVSNLKEPYATFAAMKRIGNDYGYYGSDSAATFCKQAEFMKDFVDDYGKTSPLFSYYTTYIQMDDEQLRTYFSWRTKVRQGNIEDISLSYAFCYIYELINNIGISNAKDGIDKLINFWTGFRRHDSKIDSYLPNWIKDYYIVNNSKLEDSFKDVSRRYPIPYKTHVDYMDKLKQGIWDINFLEMHSTYKITQKRFYINGNTKEIEECISTVLNALNRLFATKELNFINLFISGHEQYYSPFSGAVYKSQKNINKVVKLNEYESYICKDGEWTSQVYSYYNFPRTKGYMLKKIEIQMRKVFGSKQGLKEPSDTDMLPEFVTLYSKDRIMDKRAYELIKSTEFEQTIFDTIIAFHKEVNKTVVTVDHTSLTRIRQEALETQGKLVVEEETLVGCDDIKILQEQQPLTPAPVPTTDVWQNLKSDLTATELQALEVILQMGNIKKFADDNSIMIEVLIDSINEKAMDYTGDNLIDENFVLYDEYTKQVKELIQ